MPEFRSVRSSVAFAVLLTSLCTFSFTFFLIGVEGAQVIGLTILELTKVKLVMEEFIRGGN